VQTARGHLLARRLERDDGRAKRRTQQRRERAAQAVADDPDVRLGIHVREVVVEIRADGIEQAVVNERLLDAISAALPAAAIAPADGRPRPVDARAAAAEQQVVVQLVFLDGRAPAAEQAS
jgi:hypothetical protein